MKVGSNDSIALYNTQKKENAQAKALDSLASGEKNKLENPAIAMIANAMMSGIVEMGEGIKNANVAHAMMEVAGGAVNEISDMSMRLQELSVSSNSAVLNSEQQSALSAEFNATVESINMTFSSAKFNGNSLFGNEMDFSFGKSNMSFSLSSVSTEGLSIDSSASIEEFMNDISSLASTIGSKQNSFEAIVDNLTESMINHTAARSQMNDADIAEMVNSFEQNDIQINASLIAQSHKQDISAQRIATLLN
jgi:flagellin